MSTKRQDYISWDEYFMGVAMLSGMRSKDPNTQVGACIVSDKHKILSWGKMDFQTGGPVMIFHGYAKAMTTNTFTLPTVN